ncbi:hypothetical protein EZY14_009385 [Kordia sp. TARA_039_SRF]|nr:hypothetical protein EZY14_009385 [Kordia sp. TARA_039_SRF]
MNHLNIETSGFPATNYTWRFLQNAYQEVINALTNVVGDNLIISGVNQYSTNQISDGFIIYNGELLLFQGGIISSNVIIVEEVEFRNYNQDNNNDQQGDSHPTYITRYAKCGSGEGQFPLSSLTRIDTVKQLSEFEQIQSDWNQSVSTEPDFIRNKPTNFLQILKKGTVSVGDVANDQSVTVAISPPISSNYMVIPTIVSNGTAAFDNDLRIIVEQKASTFFKLSIAEASGAVQNVSVDYILIPL